MNHPTEDTVRTFMHGGETCPFCGEQDLEVGRDEEENRYCNDCEQTWEVITQLVGIRYCDEDDGHKYIEIRPSGDPVE